MHKEVNIHTLISVNLGPSDRVKQCDKPARSPHSSGNVYNILLSHNTRKLGASIF